MRTTIKSVVPNAKEAISYGMPAHKYHGPLVYFAAYKNYIGFYATPSGHKAFAKELINYKQGKGSVQFSLGEPIPYRLIERIVKFRAEENLAKANVK
ncbi:iron chaperone [Zobellia roscoffensis]|uniref:iron chaperone n=1 Tax=Zobellia roscoffensis TaxID=2779508 RepID=UPI00293BBE18|nr:DUF1801 domain-containing protein [Zobellia roscoffensis]